MMRSLFAVVVLSLWWSTMIPAQQTVQEDVRKTVQLLDKFWAGNFKRAGLAYHAPLAVKAYQHTGQSACGVLSANNAYYCPADRSIYYHLPFLTQLRERHGAFSVPCVVAHEYGHFIVASLNIRFRWSVQEELCADCLSGAFMSWLSEKMNLHNGEFIQGGRTFFDFGDSAHYPWFMPGAHGKASQRVRAFYRGYFSGYSVCFDVDY